MSLSNVQFKAFGYVEIHVYSYMVNVKTFSSPQMPKLGMGLVSNVQLKFPDDDIRTQ